MFYKIHPVHNCKSTVVDESSQDDPIFLPNAFENSAFHRNNFLSQDSDYRNPDKKQYIFSTMGKDVRAIFQNNMVVPVRTKDRINNSNMHKVLHEMTNKVEVNGIYIVEYITLHNNSRTNINNIVDYYRNTANLPHNVYIKDAVFRQCTGVSKDNLQMEVSIRIMTFIPEYEVLENGYIYVPSSDIVLATGEINDRVAHPRSHVYKNDSIISNTTTKNAIEIDIIDNHNSDPYYFPLGSKIHKIYPDQDIHKEDGITIKKHINGTKQPVERSYLGDSDELGIYKSKDQADHKGNVDKNIELMNTKLKLEQLEHDKIKLEKDFETLKAKYEHELRINRDKEKLSKIDIQKKYIDVEITYRKHILEMKSFMRKNKIEMEKMSIKYDHEISKLRVDTGVRLATSIASIVKIIKT